MPRVSTALNVLNFIISVKGRDPEISELISITGTVPNYSAGITASPGSWWHRATLAKTTPDLPCSATLSLLEGNRVTLWCHWGFLWVQAVPIKNQQKSLKERVCCWWPKDLSREGLNYRVPRWLQVGKYSLTNGLSRVRAVQQLKGFQNLTPINYLSVGKSWISKNT